LAITINWLTGVINIPKADTTLVDSGPPEIRSLDLNAFRLTLKGLEAGEEGQVFLDTHEHLTEQTLQGDVYARMIIFINNYTVQFEDGQYTVRPYGANSNISDVKVQNQVSIDTRNSGGLIRMDLSSPDIALLAAGVWDRLLTAATHNLPTSAGRRLRQLGDVINATVDDSSPGLLTFATDLTESKDGFYDDQYIRFISGNLSGQVRIISFYDGTTKEITVDEPWSEAPADTDEFELLPVHIHPADQITAADMKKIDGSALAAQNLATAEVVLPKGAIDDTNFSPTLTEFECNIVCNLTDAPVGRVLIFWTGNLIHHAAEIKNYSTVSGRGHYTIAANMPGIPSNGDEIVLH
jgi:hypothetical protein